MPKTYVSPDGIKTELETMGEFAARYDREQAAAYSWTCIKYYPADVPVSDDRETVKGASVHIYDLNMKVDEGLVIPPEGDGDLSCWLGELATREMCDDPDLLDALATAAERGARGESGTIE